MLRKHIEDRERALYARDNNRKSLPFEWGLEHVGFLTHLDENPAHTLHEFASRALAASDAFYSCEPAALCDFDGHLLKFPSAIETLYPENNVVWGRFFGARKDLAAVVLPHWNCKWDALTGLCRALQRCGITALRLSLPYHHHRMPAELERAEYLISP